MMGAMSWFYLLYDSTLVIRDLEMLHVYDVHCNVLHLIILQLSLNAAAIIDSKYLIIVVIDYFTGIIVNPVALYLTSPTVRHAIASELCCLASNTITSTGQAQSSRHGKSLNKNK